MKTTMQTTFRWALPALCLALVACGGKSENNSESRQGNLLGVPVEPSVDGKTDVKVFDEAGALLNPRGDSDGDGIPDEDEVTGYTITVDTNGFGVVDDTEQLEVRRVTSDPRFADSDGDGLTDGEERAATSDPRRVDSDGDTLPDFDELKIWKTSPVSIDSDGDARGGDPENLRPPRFQLFDGAELNLVEGADGRLRPGVGATNPNDVDTDGDGLNDYEEYGSTVRRPTVADLPRVRIRRTPGSRISVGFITENTEGVVDSNRFVETAEEGVDMFTQMSTTAETTSWFENSVETFTSASASAGCCRRVAEAEMTAGVKVTNETGLETTLSMDMTATMTARFSQTSTTVARGERSNELTVTGGVMRMSIDVINDSAVPMQVQDVTFTVYSTRGGTLTPVAELTTDEDFVLSTGAQRTLFLERDDLEIGPIRAFMRNASGFAVVPSTFNIADANDVNRDFQYEEVAGRSAHLTVNFGDQRVVELDVAAPRFAPGSARRLRDLMSEANIPFSVEADETVEPPYYKLTVDGQETELHEGEAPALDEILPYSEASGYGPGLRRVKRGWFVSVVRADPRNAPDDYYDNPLDVEVFAGDRVALFYAYDRDQDGVPGVVEQRFGASDDKIDTDGDGLSDFWEIREGWSVTVDEETYYVTSNPGSRDFDRDGLSDAREWDIGTDPWVADTDRDGLDDRREWRAIQEMGVALDPLDSETRPDPPTITCTVEDITQTGEDRLFVLANETHVGRQLFTDTGGAFYDDTCPLAGGFGDAPCSRASNGFYWMPRELRTLDLEAVSQTPTQSEQGCGGSCTFRVPFGYSERCMVILAEVTPEPYVLDRTWTAIPCHLMRDSDIDGYADVIAIDDQLARDIEANLRFVGRGPDTDRLGVLEQLFTVQVDAGGADVAAVEWREDTGAMMQRTLGAVASATETFTLANACVDPSMITVVARDVFGFEVEAVCEYAGGEQCTE